MAGIIVSAFILIRFGTIGGGKSQEGASVLTDRQTQEKMQTVQTIIAQDYLNDVDSQSLETYLFKGIAAGLDDRYASYYSAEEMEEVSRVNTGSYHGIGVVFQEDPGTGDCIVMTVYESGPAMRAGVREGDILLAVNGEDVTGMDFSDAVDLIRESDEAVDLTFLRDGAEITLQVDFDEVLLTQVTGQMLEDQIGCLVIPEFDEVTVGQFEEMIDSLKQQGMQALILDVRDNPGGLLTSVTAMLDDLMDEKLLVTTRTRGGKEEKIYSDSEQLFDGPIAVLTNENSASASEVFAGVLQYYDLAKVVGGTTYGKGVVQSTYTLSDGSAFKLTTEKYFIAGETDIDGVGVQPDLFAAPGLALDESEEEAVSEVSEEEAVSEVSEEDAVLEAAVTLLRDALRSGA